MALKNGKPNPLDYFKMRRVDFACPHFEFFTINKSRTDLLEYINEWILKNLNSRYYIGKGISLDSNNAIVYNITIGFESEKELSFFTIACPYIHSR
jgi:hypothetical protein